MSNQVIELADRLEQSDFSFLGRLSWYSISDASVKVTHAEFTQACKDAGVTYVLPGVRAVDVFKRACSQAEVTRYQPSEQDRIALGFDKLGHINYTIRNAGSDPKAVWKVLVRELVDVEDHALEHEQIATVTFQRVDNSVKSNYLGQSGLLPCERQILLSVNHYYENELETITPNAVRYFVTRMMEWNMRSVMVRSTGGVYFVNEAFADELAKLKQVVRAVGGQFVTLPLVDDGDQREMLRSAYETECKGDVDKMMAEIMTIMQSGKPVPQAKYLDYLNRLDHNNTKLTEYSDLLGEKLDNAQAYMTLLREQVTNLLDHLEIPE